MLCRPAPRMLCAGYRTGRVQQEDIDTPRKSQFFIVGAMEACSQLLGFTGASRLPGQQFVRSCVQSGPQLPAFEAQAQALTKARSRTRAEDAPLQVSLQTSIGPGDGVQHRASTCSAAL